MDEVVLERVYQENLEERIIERLAENKDISLEEAMDIYYKSSLSDMVHNGIEGIQYLDYKILARLVDVISA